MNTSVPTTPQVAAAPQVATKKVKVNPSAELIGITMNAGPQGAHTVNYRKGKTNVVNCAQVEITGANPTGRRLTVIFRDADGKEIMTRRVYKEYVERMADTFGVDLP